MQEYRQEEYTQDEYKEFFEWLLDREVKMNKEVDISLLTTHDKPYIYYPDEIKKLLQTEAMQRLGKVTQLGTEILYSDMTYHTRLAHSKGAGNNATKFYIKQFQNADWRKAIEENDKKIEIFADIIQLYVHDIGHNVLSHTLESLIQSNSRHAGTGAAHEILGIRILNEDQEIVQLFNDIHPRLLSTLNDVWSESYDLKLLKEGTIDFDRLDFMTRDPLYMGFEADRELAEKLIQNCSIELEKDKNDKLRQIPVFPKSSQLYIEQFIESRAQNYKNYYCSNKSMATERMVVYFCKRLADSEYECDLKNYIKHCIEKGGDGIEIDEFKAWNDVRYYNEVIKIAEACQDKELQELAINCLPSLDGLANIALNLVDSDVDKMKDYEKEFFVSAREIVTKPGALHDKLKNRKEITYLDATSVEDEKKVLEMLQVAGISKEKIDSLISWKRPIKMYKKSEPILMSENKDVKVFEKDWQANDNVNVGVLALPIQMKENGFTEDEIYKTQEIFRTYNEKSKLYKSTSRQEKGDNSLLSELEDWALREEEK